MQHKIALYQSPIYFLYVDRLGHHVNIKVSSELYPIILIHNIDNLTFNEALLGIDECLWKHKIPQSLTPPSASAIN